MTTQPVAAPAAVGLAPSANDDRTLVVSRWLAAPRALVFRAWTDPTQVALWWGPQGYTTIHCEMDIRPGGRYRFGMRSPAGSEHWKVGVYREILAPERLVFTFAWEDAAGGLGHEVLTTVTFAAQEGGTWMTLRQEIFATVSACDSHRVGWTSCLERFAQYVANL